jgi:hypothetical protein
MPPIRHLRDAPDDCLVGDGVPVASVPEWSTGASLHEYQPLGGSLTAAALNAIVEDSGDEREISRRDALWTFELEAGKVGDDSPAALWRRVT